MLPANDNAAWWRNYDMTRNTKYWTKIDYWKEKGSNFLIIIIIIYYFFFLQIIQCEIMYMCFSVIMIFSVIIIIIT